MCGWQLKGEAFRTLAAMKNTKDEGFIPSFMTKIDFAAKFDYHVRFEFNPDVITLVQISWE